MYQNRIINHIIYNPLDYMITFLEYHYGNQDIAPITGKTTLFFLEANSRTKHVRGDVI